MSALHVTADHGSPTQLAAVLESRQRVIARVREYVGEHQADEDPAITAIRRVLAEHDARVRAIRGGR